MNHGKRYKAQRRKVRSLRREYMKSLRSAVSKRRKSLEITPALKSVLVFPGVYYARLIGQGPWWYAMGYVEEQVMQMKHNKNPTLVTQTELVMVEVTEGGAIAWLELVGKEEE